MGVVVASAATYTTSMRCVREQCGGGGGLDESGDHFWMDSVFWFPSLRLVVPFGEKLERESVCVRGRAVICF